MSILFLRVLIRSRAPRCPRHRPYGDYQLAARAFLHARPLMSAHFSSLFVSVLSNIFFFGPSTATRWRSSKKKGEKRQKRYLTTWLISNHARALIITSRSTDVERNVNEMSRQFVIVKREEETEIFLGEKLTQPDLKDENSLRIPSEGKHAETISWYKKNTSFLSCCEQANLRQRQENST